MLWWWWDNFIAVTVKLTNKPLTNSRVADEAPISVIRVTFSKSLIDSPQVQVDSIMKIKRYAPSILQNFLIFYEFDIRVAVLYYTCTDLDKNKVL